MIYAGIGSRETPPHILEIMTHVSNILTNTGWKLRSGHAEGADRAFEIGSINGEIHLPWTSYNREYSSIPGNAYCVPEFTDECMELTAGFHPAWANLSGPVRKLMARNATILFGLDLASQADMIICWTKNGLVTGGTGHGLRMAEAYKIPIFNLAIDDHWDKLDDFIDNFEKGTST